jgi:peptidoglycan/LPS O-acetylase OafA/YrhL
MSQIATGSAAGPAARLGVLDGWRGISVLLVMACHLLPLGPKSWQFNEAAGPLGMVLFFTLSGFLITRFLLRNDSVGDFLIRRFFRIVPLAWLGSLIALTMQGSPGSYYLPHLLFYANIPPLYLSDIGSHLWSLCVEVQFYVGIALVVRLFGVRALYILPVLCVVATVAKVLSPFPIDNATLRVDEILAGGVLALVYEGRFGARPQRWLTLANPYALLAALLVASHPDTGALGYLRPYIATALVGATLFSPPPRMAAVLQSRVLAYVATISFAIYVLHHILMFTWLGTGEKWVMYAKRPLLFAATFALAHLSTFHFERRFIELGHRLTTRNARGQTTKKGAAPHALPLGDDAGSRVERGR